MFRSFLLCSCLWLFVTSTEATIDVAVKTPECVVFASDARVTLADGSIGSDTYEKIVVVTKFVIAQMAGDAAAGNKNLKTTIQDFRWQYKLTDTSSLTIDSVVILFRQYCKKNRSLGVDYSGQVLRFAGPDVKGNIQLYAYLQPAGNDTLISFGQDVYAIGNTHYFFRLIHGIEPDLKDDLVKLLGQNLPDSTKTLLTTALDFMSSKYNLLGNYGAVTTLWSKRDAIDYANMLVNTTLICDRMCVGKYRVDLKAINPVTGGKILLCVVTRDGVEWILPPEINLTK